MTFPTLLLDIAFASDPLAAPAWTAIAETKLRHIHTSRGRGSELDAFSAGTMSVVLDNRDRAFDPFFTTGAHYGQLAANKQIRLRATHNGVTYPVFYGYTDEFPQDYELGGDQTVTLTATDGFKILNRIKLFGTPPFAEELSGTRVQNILSAAKVGWPAGLRSVSWGSSTVIAKDASSLTALEALLEVARTEQGLFVMSRAGEVVFASRNDLVTGSWATTPWMTFGDAGGEVPYKELKFDGGESLIRNDIEVTHPVFDAVYATDPAATLLVSFSVDTIDASPAALRSMAENLLRNYKDQQPRVSRLVVPYGACDAGQWASVLSVDLGTRCKTMRRPTGGGNVIDHEGWLDRIEHDIEPNKTWDASFAPGLAQDGQNYGVWDTAVWDSDEWGW